MYSNTYTNVYMYGARTTLRVAHIFVSETVLSCVSLIFDFVSMSAVENHKSLTGRPISTSAVLHIVEYSSYNLRALAVNLQPHC